METPGWRCVVANVFAQINPKTIEGAKQMSAFRFGFFLVCFLPFIGFLCRVAVELFSYGYNAL
jgi:hypothetical protein